MWKSRYGGRKKVQNLNKQCLIHILIFFLSLYISNVRSFIFPFLITLHGRFLFYFVLFYFMPLGIFTYVCKVTVNGWLRDSSFALLFDAYVMIFQFLSLLDIQGNRVATPSVVNDLGIDVETNYLFFQLILCFQTCRTS